MKLNENKLYYNGYGEDIEIVRYHNPTEKLKFKNKFELEKIYSRGGKCITSDDRKEDLLFITPFETGYQEFRFKLLMKRQSNGQITDLKYNDKFEMYLNGEFLDRFNACFSYISILDEKLIVEFTKKPDKYTLLKIKLMKIIHGIDVELTIKNSQLTARD